MKYLFIPILFSICLILESHVFDSATNSTSKNSTSPSDFQDLLKKYKIGLAIPNNFHEIKVNKNSDISYQFSIKHDTCDFEIRFSIKDISKTLNLPPDDRSLSLFTSIVLNASGFMLPNIPEIQNLGNTLSKKEYNADWAATSSFNPNSNFAKGFNICSIIAMRKNEVAEVYIFFLMKNKQPQILSQSAKCLRFN